MSTKDQAITLDKCIARLIKLRQRHGNLPLIYSIDDEGNAYNYVFFIPTAVEYNESSKEIKDNPRIPNAICIN